MTRPELIRRMDGWLADGEGEWSRTDPDGTVWTITAVMPGDYALTMGYRDHKLVSHHVTAQAAMAHRDDMARMLTARTFRDYPGSP